MTNTRSAVSAKTASVAPHVHCSCPGNCDGGFGQSRTTSYGPVRSQPPFSPGTAANPEPGCVWLCTEVDVGAMNRPPPNATATVSNSAGYLRIKSSLSFEDARIGNSSEDRQVNQSRKPITPGF